jgi:hypothetical protein
MYTLSVFRELREQYPQWSALKEFLESSAGGKLRVIECEQEGLYIIRYDKATTDFSKPHVLWFRSVVWDGRTNLPLCVAPPKANQGLPQAVPPSAVASDDLRWEPFLEGVMINTYQSLMDTAPQLSTRSKLGASGVYYSKRPFSELLSDALTAQETTLSALLGGVPDRGAGQVATFTSLLLEHPEHRIVAKVTAPRVTRIHTGTVLATGDVQIEEALESNGVPAYTAASAAPPTTLTSEVTGRWMTGEAERWGWQWQGVVMKDGKGGRWRLRSTPYMMVRAMRGDTPRQDVRFLGLRQRSMVDTYLYYYPEEQAALRRYEQEVRAVTERIYQAYVAAHITKTTKFGDLPQHWKPHVFSLHGLYLGTLRPQGFFVRKREVITYVNILPIPRLLHLLRKLRDANAVEDLAAPAVPARAATAMDDDISEEEVVAAVAAVAIDA